MLELIFLFCHTEATQGFLLKHYKFRNNTSLQSYRLAFWNLSSISKSISLHFHYLVLHEICPIKVFLKLDILYLKGL